jgi:hypothetical protein
VRGFTAKKSINAATVAMIPGAIPRRVRVTIDSTITPIVTRKLPNWVSSRGSAIKNRIEPNAPAEYKRPTTDGDTNCSI